MLMLFITKSCLQCNGDVIIMCSFPHTKWWNVRTGESKRRRESKKDKKERKEEKEENKRKERKKEKNCDFSISHFRIAYLYRNVTFPYFLHTAEWMKNNYNYNFLILQFWIIASKHLKLLTLFSEVSIVLRLSLVSFYNLDFVFLRIARTKDRIVKHKLRMVTWDCQALNILAGYLRETTFTQAMLWVWGWTITVVQCLQFWGAFPKIIVSQLWSQVL